MGLSDQPFEVMCPDCGAMLKVDPVTRSVIAHTSAPKKKMFEDFGEAAKALREADARRDSIFAQSVDAQKNKDDVMAKKFAEAVKKAKETPLTDRPLRDFDLDYALQLVAKLNLEKGENFRLPKVTVNPPAFTIHFTTNSPQNYHPEHHVFPKTPC